MKSVCLVTCNITRFTGGNNLDISHQCNNVHVSSQFLCQNCEIQTNINLLWPPLFSRLSFRPSVFQPNFCLLWEVSIKDQKNGESAFYIEDSCISALKGNSQLWDRADLDTSFEKSSPQPEIKVHLEFHFNLRSVLLDFQSFSEKPVF